ncbi:bifunctional 2-C-methyl-D-erythritol 4-phosphate cytidylyltransferase/2-C-methyl-D-erythritol 2,4-cyclodiphosphate synthase [Mesorhizobium sp. M00.F.Ca.ET.216.01.1.1]|uniref:bifunctional 2-C-methyl-D-erythritol 4-phosphate cytidylyltransferase/2-C-methyl-D-erythritol 2,4-cyclodiphosphate synthase n=1 Tax=Mesorhizobium sp. M00.F.Ca.ET.216.01.1.1 TaxID=2500528 RepID=UPI000FDB408A|nr:bifunctional 2-C-methyl-D-erythritol 4-phosphate cytidylyltransferase/2-C-methyl-D-erythritol 2,4-cyclodiphosphate synthase [Mesorhizobium sp. M00.F.Ca.ET.216.01.1.1]TGQ48103.1 bifunctional 2-C-methyl-D-erythritol 4-phosphate cytidylyltransferase/2-C-methyl-D-erythritol 2,4-cyclodiphosphate synthase [Mesorhizobium sp. M00.F.Ca.ET.216.01.1.1]TJW18184.1 MAG: bifunctional 2-C-methyl-D-erythritol 4-phosphate cytidylyltransferase/2-C-methyl-D-erythritol 2,4-cyclodiphosphate synthase [Mesorhizobium 
MTDASEMQAPATDDKVAVVIVAAGRGARAGQADGPKQYQSIGGRAIIARTLDMFLEHPRTGPVVVAIHADDRELFRRAAGASADRVTAIVGGSTRQDSVRLGLLALRAHAPSRVLVHDAVRPFVDAGLIDRTIEAIGERQGALPALPVADTLKRESAAGMIGETVSRDGLHAAQTPQGFPFWPILAAHEKAHHLGKVDFTDDAAIAEWAHIPVKIVPGSPDNVKLTWARDIAMADQRLSGERPRFPDIRTGNGYDVHAFEPGDHVTLCGISIPHGKKLSGHSDADVALHALTDALLATCGAGDIGTHFPPSDPQWKGAASRIFVEHAAKLVRERGGRIANADITLICEAPRVGPHRDAMTKILSAMLGISADRVSIKATTNEKLGFVGREEGIAAIATASVVFPGDVPE